LHKFYILICGDNGEIRCRPKLIPVSGFWMLDISDAIIGAFLFIQYPASSIQYLFF